MTVAPDPAAPRVPPEVRAAVAEAEAALVRAVDGLRAAGLPDSAKELDRARRRAWLTGFLGPGMWFDIMDGKPRR